MLIFFERKGKIMEVLIYIFIFILGVITTMIFYSKILSKFNSMNENKYKKIIKEQTREIKFLKKELEEIESNEFFNND